MLPPAAAAEKASSAQQSTATPFTHFPSFTFPLILNNFTKMKFFAITVLVLLFVTFIASLEASGMTLSAEQPESKIDRKDKLSKHVKPFLLRKRSVPAGDDVQSPHFPYRALKRRLSEGY